MDPSDLRVVAHRLRVDGWTAEAVRALRAGGVRSVLLKGPTISRWLYPGDATARSYGDADLLVRSQDRARARAILEDLGYTQDGDPLLLADEPHARAFRRGSDHAAVDLHTSFHGLQRVPADDVWRVIATGTDLVQVGGLEVEVPAEHVRAMLLALHISPKNQEGNRAWQDLLDGIRLLEEDVWRAAAAVARELRVDDEVGYRLALPVNGRELAERLGLPTTETASYAESRLTETGSSPPGAGSLLRLGDLHGLRARGRYVRDKLLPPPDVLRDRLPRATALIGERTARLLWVGLCVVRLPRAVVVVARLRRR